MSTARRKLKRSMERKKLDFISKPMTAEEIMGIMVTEEDSIYFSGFKYGYGMMNETKTNMMTSEDWNSIYDQVINLIKTNGTQKP